MVLLLCPVIVRAAEEVAPPAVVEAEKPDAGEKKDKPAAAPEASKPEDEAPKDAPAPAEPAKEETAKVRRTQSRD